MKPFLSLLSFRSLIAATLLASVSPELASAQTKPEAAQVPEGAPVRLDIEFPSKAANPQGTSLKTAVDLLLAQFRAAGQPVNVVFKNGDADEPAGQGISSVTVPPMSLRQVTFDQAIQALAFVAKPSVTLQGDAKLFVMEASVTPAKLRVFNVSEFLLRDGKDGRNNRLKMLRSAITKGITLGRVANPLLELDDDSGLLFATGSPEALEIVSDVTRALSGPSQTPTPASAASVRSSSQVLSTTSAPQTRP